MVMLFIFFRMKNWFLLFLGVILGGVTVAIIGSKSSVSNTEVWEWIDYKGRKRRIVVKREIH